MGISFDVITVLAGVFLLAIIAEHLHGKFFSSQGIHPSIPWIGVQNGGFFARVRATTRSFLNTKSLVLEGYHKYSKQGLPFVLPNIATGPEVILPLSNMEWLLQQPDNVLSQNEVNRHFLQADYTMLHPKVIVDGVHHDVIRKELTKGLGEFTSDVQNEIDFAFRNNWGVDTKEWKEVTAYDTMSDVIGRISNRVFVGFPLCRDEDYLKNSRNFARLVILQSVFISLLPKLFQPIFAPFINFFDYLRYLRCCKKTIPIIKERLATFVPDEKKKSDYIQWSINHSYNNSDPSERSIDLISKRLCALSFAAIQSSAITLCNLALDLAASPNIDSYLHLIREEVELELAAEKGIWTKAALARMTTLDAFLRESMRMWGFVSRGVLKEVVAPGGTTLPNGIHIPQGTKVGIHAYPIHRDSSIYPDADVFDPFRGTKGTPLVNSSPTFLAFSTGRHGCPGRFFAAQQLKLVLAYIACNYEIEPLKERPGNDWFVGSQAPPLRSRIRIRRRVGTV